MHAMQAFANAMAGNILEFPEITATTRADAYGCYGYSGQTLNTITGDLEGQLFTALDNSAVVPDLILGLALLENDVGQNQTYAQMVTSINKFISVCRARFPGAKIIISGCYPSFGWNATQLGYRAQINNYIHGLSNGSDIYTFIPNAYEDPASPGAPVKTVVTGTIASNVLTVTEFVSGQPIRLGDLYEGTSVYISALTNGAGGVGTYTLTGTVSNIASPSTINIMPYTDNGVHPRPRGVIGNARKLANLLTSIYAQPRARWNMRGVNVGLIGSAAISATNLSGTVPTGISLSGSAFVTTACEAQQPGLRVTFSNIPDSSLSQETCLLYLGDSGELPETVTAIKAIYKFKVVSGAQYIRGMDLRYRLGDNGTLGGAVPMFPMHQTSSNSVLLEEGEWYTISTPILRATGFDNAKPGYYRAEFYFGCFADARIPSGEQIVIDYLSIGFEYPYLNKGIAKLVAGSVTVSTIDAKILANSKIKLSCLTPGGTPGALFVSAKTAGTSFVISSTSVLDTSLVAWEIDNK